jgi:acyl-homoserine lactone acylase PvdQ
VSRALAVLAIAIVFFALPAAAGAQGEVTVGQDYGGFRNVLPGGQGENVNGVELAQYELNGDRPASFTNQLKLYTDIVFKSPTLTPEDVQKFFKPAGFGKPDDAGTVSTPRAGVRIVRDELNVPHIFGATHGDVAFGAGYASGQDRLFLMDVLRHTGRGTLTELIGAGTNDSTVKMDAAQLKVADYSEEELQSILDSSTAQAGAEGAQIRADFDQYVAGINQYISEARSDSSKMPAEYPALGRPQGPDDWKGTDTVAVASLIGGIFGKGGGVEGNTSQVMQSARKRFGSARARKVFRDFRTEDDPERPNTVAARFPFDRPGKVNPKAVALPDLNSIEDYDPVVSGGSSSSSTGASGPNWLQELQRRGIVFPRRESNVMLVDSQHSKSGRAFAIMGPQVGYYSPQILMEMDLHGGGYDARGATFPGISLYVLLGRGQDFAWSATTATTDTDDEFVEQLCNADGSAPTRASQSYMYKGKCVPFTKREYTVTTPVAATDPSPPRSITFRALRSVHGPVQATALVRGKPVAIVEARSTYFHEVDSTLAFKRFNYNDVHDPGSFQLAARFINFAFNWFYVDDRDIGFLQSGWYPRRARGVDPSLPAWGTGQWDWRGFKPDGNRARRLPFASLPKAADPPSGYLVNWNNAQAPGWRAADDVWSFGPIHRSQLLEKPLQRTLRQGKADLTRLVQINIEAATVDVRREVYPFLRRMIGNTTDQQVKAPLAILDEWAKTGMHRRDLDGDNVYENSAAVALMDEWWGRLVTREFRPILGSDLFERIRKIVALAEPPDPGGSSFWGGWHGYVSKDIRRLLGRKVRNPLSRIYCGKGSRTLCSEMLISTLVEAATAVRLKYNNFDLNLVKVPATCGSPRTCDQIEFTAAGAVGLDPIPWQNRPTFQQAVEVLGHRPR